MSLSTSQIGVVLACFILAATPVTAVAEGGFQSGDSTSNTYETPENNVLSENGVEIEVTVTRPEPTIIRYHYTIHLDDKNTEMMLSFTGVQAYNASGLRDTGTYDFVPTGNSNTLELTVERDIESEVGGEIGLSRVAAEDWSVFPFAEHNITIQGETFSILGESATNSMITVKSEESVTVGSTAMIVGDHRVWREYTGHGLVRVVVPQGTDVPVDRYALAEVLQEVNSNTGTDRLDTYTLFMLNPSSPDLEFSVDWSLYQGYATENDAFIRTDTERVNFVSTLIQEYHHTQQPSDALRSSGQSWVIEAGANYYTWRTMVENGCKGPTEYDNRITELGPYQNDPLQPKSAWDSQLTPYYKGAYVMAALDYEIRNTSDGQTLDTVIRALYRNPSTDITQYIGERTNVSRNTAQSYIRGDSFPETIHRPSAQENDCFREQEDMYWRHIYEILYQWNEMYE